MNDPASVFARLESTLGDRFQRRPGNSYTTTLFEGGAETIGTKLCEEAQEMAEAIDQPGPTSRQATIHEAADVVYHLMVAMQFRQISWQDVANELARRKDNPAWKKSDLENPASALSWF